jgi:hypothetical protein
MPTEAPARPVSMPGVTTVILSSVNDDELKQYRCHRCGKVAFEYYNEVKIVVPGRPGYANNHKVFQCPGKLWVGNGQSVHCKQKYFVA